MQKAAEYEVIHGRWAMLAIPGIVAQEQATGVPWYETGAYEEAREERHHFDHDLHVFHVADADHSGSVTRDDWAQAEGDLARFAGYDENQDGQVVIAELVPPSLGFSPGNVVDIFTDSKFLFTCANVCLLLFLFIRFGGKPVGAFLAERESAS